MDLLCHPTTRDCSAIVVAEAGIASVPSITTNVGGIPELIEHGRTGYVFERGDDASFVEAIVGLARSPEVLAEMKAQARRKAQTEFAAEVVFASIVTQVHHSLGGVRQLPKESVAGPRSNA
jgi:glycosyltransferase involved in cell wall biosynthesis